MIVHTGDFKIDFTPQDGAPLNFGRFAELGNQGVLALLADSTNVERPGYTISEKKVAETFNSLFAKANGSRHHRHVRQRTYRAFSPWWIRPCALDARSVWSGAAWSTSQRSPCSWDT